ncbi:MAG TPA: SPOR domain-containing protein [Syntrophales bacterium]|nr:SPOR domain-containing protein [Syntrophales bacterium]HPQ42613.1 SPOR domain-containing protein [Syntrophales bacterium]
MNDMVSLILIAGLIIAIILTYLFESWRYKKFVSSLDTKSYFNQLIPRYSRIVYIAGEFIICLIIVSALAVPFISRYGLSECENSMAPPHVEDPSGKSPIQEDVVLSQVQPLPEMPSSLPYTLQIGAFERSENLDQRMREIETRSGMHVFIGEAQIGDTKWYRMFVGHFLTPDEARQFGQSLVLNKVIKDYLVQEKKFVQNLHVPSKTQQIETPATIEKPESVTKAVKHSILAPKPVEDKPVGEDGNIGLTVTGFKRRPYTIQVAAFKDMGNLHKGTREIWQSGIHDTLSGETVVSGTRWYRLYIGHFQSAQEAQQFGQSLVRRKILSTYLVKRISYTVLLGSFYSEDDIREYIKNKISGDINSYIIPPVEGSTDSAWFLATGVFPEKKSAEDFAADLRDRGYRLAEVTRK